jgi:hypothetical protein
VRRRRAKEKRERARFIHARAGDFVPSTSGAPPSSTQRHAGGAAGGTQPRRGGGAGSDGSGSDEDVRLCVPAPQRAHTQALLRGLPACATAVSRIALSAHLSLSPAF